MLRKMRAFFAGQAELQERLSLLRRPWEEAYLHWSGDQLHGYLVPPHGRRRGVTRGGWCIGLSSQRPDTGADSQQHAG